MTESDSVESEIAGTRRDPPAAARRGIAEAARGALLIGASLMAMNAFNYVFTVLAARRLGPPDFGAFAALMGLVLVVNVVAIGIQAAAARRVASSPARSGTTVRTVRRASWQAGVVLGFLCLAAPRSQAQCSASRIGVLRRCWPPRRCSSRSSEGNKGSSKGWRSGAPWD